MRITSGGDLQTYGSNRLNLRDDGSYIYEDGGLSIGNGGTGTGRPIKFLTENTERMRIDSSGNVLINSGVYLSWGTNGASSIEGSTVSNKLQFRTNSTDAMIIDSSQNVGIGVTPESWGTSGDTQVIRISTMTSGMRCKGLSTKSSMS